MVHRIDKSQFNRFDLLVVHIHHLAGTGKIVRFKNIQSHESRNSVSVGGNFPDVIPSVVDADGLHPLRMILP